MFKLLVLISLITGLSSKSAREEVQVIIIGAGASGIAAATMLLENGVTDIKILEAEDKIGGRICSEYLGSGFIDLGAEWFQEDPNDAVYQQAQSSNATRYSTLKRRMILSDGTTVESELSRELSRYYSIMRKGSERSDEMKLSIGQLFMKHFNDTVLENHQDSPKKLEICLEAVQTYENMINGRLGSYCWYDPAGSSDYEWCTGKIVDWNGSGFKTVLDIMIDNVKNKQKIAVDDKILLNTVVKKIKWKNVSSGGVAVDCVDGTKFKSKYVIFTPSVGVLRETYEQMFDPILPRAKRTSIETIGYGNLIKVALHFPEKWWLENDGYIFIWRTEDVFNLTEQFPHGPMQNNESWLGGAYSLTPAENNPNVLLMWFSGRFVRDMESTSDEIILNGVMFILNKFFGKSNTITKPYQMIRSTWYTNPHFRGVYIYETVESRRLNYNAIDTLAEPLADEDNNPVLLFAGEGTSRTHYSLVRGAMESGHREAERILQHLNQDSNQ